MTSNSGFNVGDNVNRVRPDGEAAEDRWVTALNLFGGGPKDRGEELAELWQRAQALFEAKDYVAAAGLLATVVDAEPNQTAPRLLLARAYYHSARLKLAEEQLRLVVERDPVESYAHLMLGRTLERQGRRAEAEPWLRSAAAFAGE